MCIVIDTCVLSCVLDSKNTEHNKFEPVYRWLTKGPGKIVYGGKTYKKEFKRSIKNLTGILAELGRQGKIIIVSDNPINDYESIVEELITKKKLDKSKYNDPHLVAIINSSKCKLVCTVDKKAMELLKMGDMYDGSTPPSIYSRKSNKNLLNNNNIAAICK